MSKPDYSQIAEDHASLLVLVRPIGNNIKPKIFNKLFERISQLNFFNVPKPHRNVRFKYRRYYTKDDSLWGSFQAHRKVLGLITIGKCSDPQNDKDSEALCQESVSRKSKINDETKSDLIKLHRQTSELFEDTLLDSILIILDSTFTSSRESTPNTPESDSNSLEKVNGEANINLQPDGSCYFGSFDEEDGKNGPKSTKHLIPRPSKTPNGEMSASHVWLFNGESDCCELESRMQDFFNSLFWVLESKRMDRSQERSDNITLLLAPPEREVKMPVDTESRAYKKKCLGRYKKHLGDLSLLAGIPGEASLHYQTCLDTLKTTNDWLWIAGAQEGLAVASYLILKPKSSRPSLPVFTRNVSFSNKRATSRSRDNSLAATLQAAAASTLQSGLDLANNRVTTSVTTEILHEDILTNYKEAIVNYSKVKESCIIEMEASLKASRILAMYRRVIDASDFLQNVVKINAPLSEDEKVDQFTTLANLYSQLGLMRKSAFYSRVAAMVCVAPSSKKESWPQCYGLLLQSLPGFRLSLDCRDMIESSSSPIGWPSVKLRVMHELIYSRRRLGDAAASIRHISLLLHSMFDHLSPSERLELCTLLTSYSSKVHSSPNSMALEDGTILPPVPLTRIPEFRSLQPLDLSAGHKLSKFKRDKIEHHAGDAKLSHPFIYSPFMNDQLEIDNKSSNKNREVTWIEGSVGHVLLKFRNTLSIELQVSNLDLIVEGSKVEVEPASFSMPQSSEDTEVVVSVTPRMAEDFDILGYTWEVFGVKSIVRFKELQQTLRKQKGLPPHHPLPGILLEEKYRVAVEPQLPFLRASLSSALMAAETSEDRCSNSSPTNAGSLVIYAGQRHNFKVTLSNVEGIAVERVDLIESSEDFAEDSLKSLIRCLNEETLNGSLSLFPGNDLELDFEVDGMIDFVSREASADVKHLETKVKGLLQKRDIFLKSLQKCTSPGGTLRTELCLLFQYGGGHRKDLCRQTAINIPLFILPSISIFAWKVLPGKSSDLVDLYLELKNSTELQIEIALEGRRSDAVGIEPGQALWIRCTLSRMSNDFCRTSNDPSIDGFKLSGVACEEYKQQLVEHLQTNVKLSWRMPVVSAEGRLPLDDIPFSTEECMLLQKPLMSWEVTWDGMLLSSDDSSSINLTALLSTEVKILLRNEAGFDFHDVELTVRLQEDEENDAYALLLVGSAKAFQNLVKSEEVLTHRFSMMSTRCATSRLRFDCRASSHPRGSPSIRSPVSSSTPSTVLLNSSSTMTLTNSSSVERVSDGRVVLSPPLCSSKPEVGGDVGDDGELPENIPSGSSGAEDSSNLGINKSNEIGNEGNELSQGEPNGNPIETARAESDVKDADLLSDDSSLDKPEDEGQTVDIKPSVKCLYGSQPPAQLERYDGHEKFENPQSKVVHKWSFELDVNSSFVRNDVGFDDCELDGSDAVADHNDQTEFSRL